ncbi:hypothetical protein [Nocardia sp. CY41]|uniref:hypothetical protein n=1 Tax=Nocardia sp. CY41 TaxID=2608686 RepID=UPI0013568B94|nr:hypothetical protein [Nocardia sp. CY41]
MRARVLLTRVSDSIGAALGRATGTVSDRWRSFAHVAGDNVGGLTSSDAGSGLLIARSNLEGRGGSGPGTFAGIGEGKMVSFTPREVKSIPLKGADGRVIGTAFPSKPTDEKWVTTWASSEIDVNGIKAKGGDLFVVPAHEQPPGTDGKRRFQYSEPQAAPWLEDVMASGRLPIYTFAHANPEQFVVSVNKGSWLRPKWTNVHLDGDTYARLLMADKHFTQAAGTNPGASVVMLSCESAIETGVPGGSVARAAAEHLHQHGGATSNIYGATGDVILPKPQDNLSELAVVQHYDDAGNPLPLFEKFSPPSPGKPSP